MSLGPIDAIALKILVQIAESLVTPESVKDAETALMDFLAALAKNTASKVDDELVAVFAKALGVPEAV